MDEIQFEEEMRFYETALSNINDQLDLITQRVENAGRSCPSLWCSLVS